MIQQTRDYSLFTLLHGNRKLQKNHVNKITMSIDQKNLMDVSPIVVNEKYEIIDGQHRFMACHNLGIPVTYIMKE
jgi:hypothetical protein